MDFETTVVVGASLAAAWGASRLVRAAVTGRRMVGTWWIATAGGLCLWWLGVFHAARQGWLQATSESNFPPILVGWIPGLAAMVVWWKSPDARRLGSGIPAAGLVGIQTFRLVGVALLWSGWRGELPLVFALPAGLGGLVTGAAAPFVAIALARETTDSVRWAKRWNLLGLLDIVVAMILGGLSGPGPNQALSLGFPSAAATGFPLAITPAFLVPLALLGHFLSWRKLSDPA